MVELAVVGDEQHAGGVRVQTSDGLNVGSADLVGQQRKHAGIVARFVRGFVTGGFVQQDVEIGQRNHHCVFAVNCEGLHAVGGDVGFVVRHGCAVDLHQAVFHQPLAAFARVDALGLEVFDDVHNILIFNGLKECRLLFAGSESSLHFYGGKDSGITASRTRRKSACAGGTAESGCRTTMPYSRKSWASALCAVRQSLSP